MFLCYSRVGLRNRIHNNVMSTTKILDTPSKLTVLYFLFQHHHFGTPDTDIDSGISSPFGRPVMDWMESVTSKAQIVPITSAVPTSSRNTSAFDMTQLKLEMTSNNNPCMLKGIP